MSSRLVWPADCRRHYLRRRCTTREGPSPVAYFQIIHPLPFAFRHQPSKALYIAASIVVVLARLPFWALTYTVSSWRPRSTWSFKRSLIVRLLRASMAVMYATTPQSSIPLEACARDAEKLGLVWIEPIPDDLVVGEVKEMAETNEVRPAKTGGFWYGPRGPDGKAGQCAAPGEIVIYHFHGGAHVPQMFNALLQQIGPNARIFGLKYRLSSAAPFQAANPFSAALLYAVAGYRYLVEQLGFDPRRVILSGDSAGGGLALNLARYLPLITLPKPGGLLLLSPTMDWGNSYGDDSASRRRNMRSDFVDTVLESGYTPRALLGKIPAEKAHSNLWISPGSPDAPWKRGLYSEVPPTIMISGGAEYTLDPMRIARYRLREDLGEDQEIVRWIRRVIDQPS
ncbi:alpha/beta-hydrolase [Pilatotrama ljubarskyi]|nr:alpha/beta-hydrolase [Pilatotrama ljubarskyi]